MLNPLDAQGTERKVRSEGNKTGNLKGTQRKGGVACSARVLGFYSDSVTVASFRSGSHGNAVSRISNIYRLYSSSHQKVELKLIHTQKYREQNVVWPNF